MITCPSCDRPNRPGAQFCVGCGTRLDRASPTGGSPESGARGLHQGPRSQWDHSAAQRRGSRDDAPRFAYNEDPPSEVDRGKFFDDTSSLPRYPRESREELRRSSGELGSTGETDELPEKPRNRPDAPFIERRKNPSVPIANDRRRPFREVDPRDPSARPKPAPRPDPLRETREIPRDDGMSPYATNPMGVSSFDTVLVPGVASRPISILCKSCERATRKKSPYCEHCGRPLTNVDGTVLLHHRWSGGMTPGGERAIYALVTVRPSIRFLSSPPARNLGMLIDMSAMERGDGHRLKMVKLIIEHAIDELEPSDTLSVCFFGAKTYLFLTAERIEDKKASKRLLHKKMETLDLGEGRFLAEAIEQVSREVRRNFSPDKVNRVILITDGPCSDPDKALIACEIEAEAGIGFSTMALSNGAYVDFLARLSATGHGKCYPEIDLRHVPEIMSQELMTVRATFTTQVELFVHVDPGWSVTRVFKISPVIVDLGRKFAEERVLSIKLSDLQLYDDQTLLLEISPVSVVPNRTTLVLCELICDFPRDDIINMSFSWPIQIPHPLQAMAEENQEVLKTVQMIMAVFGQHGLGVQPS